MTMTSSKCLLKCPRCGYEGCKNSLQKHLARKNLCPPVLEDIALSDVYERNPSWKRPDPKPKPFYCEDCDMRFTTPQARSRHKYNSCTGKNVVLSQLQEQIQHLQARIDHYANPGTGPTYQANVNCNNTVHNNITINAFGNESTQHLTHAFLSKCVRRTNQGVIDLLEKLHWDPSSPMNANIRISNRKLPLVEYNDGERWKMARKDRILNEMFSKGSDLLAEHLNDHHDEIKKSVSESMFSYIVDWFERVASEDKAAVEDILVDIYCLILNNSDPKKMQPNH